MRLVSSKQPARNQFDAKPNPQMVKLAREARGLSITRAARQAGVSPERLRRMEWGAIEPTERDVRKLSDALRFPVEFFYQTDTLSPESLWEPAHRRVTT